MDHIQKLFQLKKTNPDDVLNSPVIVTIKVDGNAFQYANDKGKKPAFCKRSSAPNKRGRRIEKFDLAYNTIYYDAVGYLRDYKDVMSPYNFVNFEIFDDVSYHTINYKLKPKHNIVLLSAFDRNNKPIEEDELTELADAMDVSRVPILYEGILNKNVQDFIKDNYETKQKLFDFMKREFNIVDDEQIEGIVLNFTEAGENQQGKLYKINNPWFIEQLYQKLDSETEFDNVNRESVYKMFIDSINSTDTSAYDDVEDYFNKLVLIFEQICQENPELVNDVYDEVYETVNSYYREDTLNFAVVEDNDELGSDFIEQLKKSKKTRFVLRFFLGAFRNIRKRPADTSKTFADTELNPTIEELQLNTDSEN